MAEEERQLSPPLVSSSMATQATAAGSGGTAAAVVVIIVWLFSLVHITIPGEVTAALGSLVAAGVHWLVIRYGMPKPQPVVTVIESK